MPSCTNSWRTRCPSRRREHFTFSPWPGQNRAISLYWHSWPALHPPASAGQPPGSSPELVTSLTTPYPGADSGNLIWRIPTDDQSRFREVRRCSITPPTVAYHGPSLRRSMTAGGRAVSLQPSTTQIISRRCHTLSLLASRRGSFPVLAIK